MTALLTVVIGLIGVYIAFALAASWVNEQIATMLQLRSKTLIAGIRAMIGEAAAADFFGHPLITSLGETPAQNIWAWLGTATGLKYAFQKAPKASTAGSPPSVAPPATKNPPYVSAQHFAVVLLDLLRKKAPSASALASLGASSTDVTAAINAISDPNSPYKPLYDILLPVWTDAKGDYDRFSDALGSWYDSHMDRVSGWYKRSVQLILLYIGLLLAFGFNLDTIQVIQELQRNSTLASTLSSATLAYYQENKDAMKSGSGTDISAISAVTKPCQTDNPCTCEAGFTATQAKSGQICSIDQSAFTQLPIGWNKTRWQAVVPRPDEPFFQKLVERGLWLKLLGLIITTVAILLGAPFWFDVLGAIVNVRSAGTKPPPSTSK